jgi:hypothetical protein
MAQVDELLQLAEDCYAQARAASTLLVRAQLKVMGDDYVKQAEELQHGRPVVQAAFQKPGSRFG